MSKIVIVFILLIYGMFYSHISIKHNIQKALIEGVYIYASSIKVNDLNPFIEYIKNDVTYEMKNYLEVTDFNVEIYYNEQILEIKYDYYVNNLIKVAQKIEVYII